MYFEILQAEHFTEEQLAGKGLNINIYTHI